METTTLFKGLVRDVSFAGLPLTYVATLIGVVLLGFIVTTSFLYAIISAAIGYPLLRALSAYDPKIISVVIITMQTTSVNKRALGEKGLTYRV